jgi:hypothetical protein
MEEIVKIKVAKLAKEKGFKEQVYSWYDDEGIIQHAGLTSDDEPIYKEDLLRQINMFSEVTNKNEYSAPLQTQLQKWLRIEHRIDICVDILHVSALNKGGKRYIWWIVDKDYNVLEDDELLGYPSYEDALEDALYKSLTLI